MQSSGKLLQTIVEEFWMPANFPLTQEVMKRALKTGRLMNEFMVLSSQSPEDAITCDIFPAIVQQTATKVYLPNPDAEYDAYKAAI
ncbi:ATPase provides energy for both assembly of type IV secretion complex and secretion of T-DNA complex (VirB4) [Vibrio variabilis]|uniref:ATPase provides energy for both assembly of type IV secretion complex and secretion of T-DNA complex (VirB4) n=1 Tax=Vibrio variabilis TaxID=990271 RepID=A0ABQ0JG55_9VIBR|nr:ATPase provides energy for both assembly of type IV secretion complex and secretion of T-DNA complex (VirB4) [Vibrio variabilis]